MAGHLELVDASWQEITSSTLKGAFDRHQAQPEKLDANLSLDFDSGFLATGGGPAEGRWRESPGSDESGPPVEQDLTPAEEATFYRRLLDAAAAEGEHLKGFIQVPVDNPVQTQAPLQSTDLRMQPQPSPTAEQDGHNSSDGKSPRQFRRACDACSRRKVRCGNVRPCSNCIELGIDCTTDRPPKRRGPPSRVIEDLKRQCVNSLQQLRSPPDTPQVRPQALPLPAVSLDAIAPPNLILQMTFEFFTFVYPIFPFPHEHVTMRRLEKREDVGSPKFCALIASMLAAVSLMSPGVFEFAARNYSGDTRQSLDSFVARCQEVCEQTKKPLKTGRVDIYDAATAFFQALACKLQNRPGVNLYATEALAILLDNDLIGGQEHEDLVVRELQSRLFWGLYSFIRMSEQVSHSTNWRSPQLIHDIIPPLPLEDFPRPPTTVDDLYLYADAIRPAPESCRSLIETFNKTTELYKSYRRIPGLDTNRADRPRSDSGDVLRRNLAALDAYNDVCRIPPDRGILETPPGLAMQKARPQVRLEIQKVVFRAALIQTRWHLARELAALGSDDAAAREAREARQRCGGELGALLEALTPAAVTSLAAFLGPGLWAVVRGLQAEGHSGGDLAGLETSMLALFAETAPGREQRLEAALG